jgi:hypothetical protein
LWRVKEEAMDCKRAWDVLGRNEDGWMCWGERAVVVVLWDCVGCAFRAVLVLRSRLGGQGMGEWE